MDGGNWFCMYGGVPLILESDKGAADIFQVLFVSFYVVSILAGALHLIF